MLVLVVAQCKVQGGLCACPCRVCIDGSACSMCGLAVHRCILRNTTDPYSKAVIDLRAPRARAHAVHVRHHAPAPQPSKVSGAFGRYVHTTEEDLPKIRI